MIHGILGSVFGVPDEKQAVRRYFQDRSLPLPRDLMTQLEQVHADHAERAQQLLRQHLLQGGDLQSFSYHGHTTIG